MAVTPHVRCEDCRPGAHPMNTATVSLSAGRGRSKCGRRLGSWWTVPEKTLGTDSQIVEAPTSFVDLGPGASARSTKHIRPLLNVHGVHDNMIRCGNRPVRRCFVSVQFGDAGMLCQTARLGTP